MLVCLAAASAGGAVLAATGAALTFDSSFADGLLFLLSFFFVANSFDIKPPFLVLFVTSDAGYCSFFSGVVAFEDSISDGFSIV